MIQAAIEHFDEQLLGVNVDFGAVKVTVGHSARNDEGHRGGQKGWWYQWYYRWF